ncbi:hypothetical protein H5410_045953 [Solanum commersonii]|uniref:Uncharacterized protein n=1 Tax=Solanum commersonii TaxID=4109 RepID=A0A9J5XD41_SOLCO|nr:hypothetical protein H5410_045953 [Solanum commersonii]
MKCYKEEVYRPVQSATCVDRRLKSVEHVYLYTRVNWTMPRTTFEVLTHWQGIGKRGSKEDWWKNIPGCIWWTLWKERNGRCFKGKVSNPEEIKMGCLSLLYFWCKQNLVGESIFSFLDMLMPVIHYWACHTLNEEVVIYFVSVLLLEDLVVTVHFSSFTPSFGKLEKQFDEFQHRLEELGSLRKRIWVVVMELDSITRLIYASLLFVQLSFSIADGAAAEPIGPGVAGGSLRVICLKELYNGQCFGPLIIGSKSLWTLIVLFLLFQSSHRMINHD